MTAESQKKWAWVEVGVFYGVVQFLIWGSGIWRPPVLLAAFLLVGICVFSNRYHQDSLERIGLAKKNFWPCFRWATLISVPFLLILLMFAWGKEARGGWDFWFSLLGYPIWGFAQEYALLGFVANRLEDALPGQFLTISFVNGLLFSLAHLPNPILFPLTFLSGLVFTRIFFKARHLVPMAFYHALFGVGVSLATAGMPGMMSVGPAYISRVGGWF